MRIPPGYQLRARERQAGLKASDPRSLVRCAVWMTKKIQTAPWMKWPGAGWDEIDPETGDIRSALHRVDTRVQCILQGDGGFGGPGMMGTRSDWSIGQAHPGDAKRFKATPVQKVFAATHNRSQDPIPTQSTPRPKNEVRDSNHFHHDCEIIFIMTAEGYGRAVSLPVANWKRAGPGSVWRRDSAAQIFLSNAGGPFEGHRVDVRLALESVRHGPHAAWGLWSFWPIHPMKTNAVGMGKFKDTLWRVFKNPFSVSPPLPLGRPLPPPLLVT